MSKRVLTVVVSLAMIMCVSSSAMAWTAYAPPTITKTGDDNIAKITQSGNLNNNATIIIEGNRNIANILQADSGLKNEAIINQLASDDGIADILQNGGGVLNSATQTQEGSIGSDAYITQTGGTNNAATQHQSGGDPVLRNYAEITQLDGQNNIADQDQSGGYGNSAKIYQTSAGEHNNEATQTQVGTDNDASTWQSNGSDNEATISQTGERNAHDVLDTGGSTDWDWIRGELSHENRSQVQIGHCNTADTTIIGNANNTIQWQEGNLNTATINIVDFSRRNDVLQIQLNNSNESTIEIHGNDNRAATYQSGGHTADISVTGNGNDATIIGSGTW